MGKIKKFAALNIRKITGGKDPLRLVEEFIARRGFDPSECQKERSPELVRWMFALREGVELEVLIEGLRKSAETTIYMGVNSITVPIRGSHDILAAALEIADGLVGIKVSLVGHYLVLSASLSAVWANRRPHTPSGWNPARTRAGPAWRKKSFASGSG